MLSIQEISKKYGKVEALSNISLEIEDGELFGIIGPDGAGKTTLFRILATLLLPDSGSVNVLGLDVVKDYRLLRERIGYMPGRFSLYQDLTIRENLQFFASVFGTTIQENYDLIAPIYRQIEPFNDRRAGQLSGGMKQKLALCCALIHKPELLLLDEPGTGVDPVSRKEFWDMLKNLRNAGLTILVSTPYMDEAALCNRVALLQKGKILAINPPENIANAFKKPLFAARSDDMFRLIQDLRQMDGVDGCYGFGEFAHLSFQENSKKNLPEIEQFLLKNGHSGIELKAIKASVEDCFIELMVK